MRQAGQFARTGEIIGVYRVWWGYLRGEKTLGSSKSKWEDNIKTDLQEVG
jgi:hypothetical protein